MRTLFAVPWFSTSGKRLLISLATALLLVSGVFALLRPAAAENAHRQSL